MVYFLALIPATALTVMGYFVFYLASRSEGGFQRFGKYLGFWAFTLAGLVILGAIFAASHPRHHGPMMGMNEMHGRMHGPWHGPGPRFFGPRGDEFQPGAQTPAAPNSPAPAAPASPASH
jgi:hypothetical protein